MYNHRNHRGKSNLKKKNASQTQVWIWKFYVKKYTNPIRTYTEFTLLLRVQNCWLVWWTGLVKMSSYGSLYKARIEFSFRRERDNKFVKKILSEIGKFTLKAVRSASRKKRAPGNLVCTINITRKSNKRPKFVRC